MDFKKRNNIPPTTFSIVYFGIVLMLLAALFALMPLHLTHAKTKEKDKASKSASAAMIAQSADSQDQAGSADATDAGASTTASDAPDPSEPSAALTASTTPGAIAPAPVNNEAENILNEVIPAPQPTSTPITPSPILTSPASSTPIITEPAPATQAPAAKSRKSASSAEKKSATTTPAAGTANSSSGNGTPSYIPQTGGQSTVASAAGYYTPLDKLSPTATYSLSALALILGISGILLFMKGQRAEEAELWIPQPLQPGETLLET